MSAEHQREHEQHAEVSIIMAAYNGEQYLAQAIDSVLAQTFGDWELLVIDDGSTDHTAEIVKEFSTRDQRIRYVYQPNAGQANARNTGIEMARGNLIAFLDQDDLWIEHKLALQIAEMRQAQVDVVFSDGYVFTNDEVSCESMSFPIVSGRYSGAEMFRLLFVRNRIPVLTSLTKKDCFINAGLLDDDRGFQNSDDYDLWLRLAANGAEFLGLTQKLVRYRLHSLQASKDQVRMLVAELAVLKKHESTSLIDDEEKKRRFSSLYQELVLALVSEGRFDEARGYLKELSRRQGLSPALIAREALLRVSPGSYKGVCAFIDRARASFAYRLGRPLRHPSRVAV
jgi:glycosyltransferase involved in cell wall biosynthesis